jgi:hypothetical protein
MSFFVPSAHHVELRYLNLSIDVCCYILVSFWPYFLYAFVRNKLKIFCKLFKITELAAPISSYYVFFFVLDTHGNSHI